MPTPFMPDEEFDARFRQGLEQYPEQPATPAAWHRMALLLDADLRQQALRRKILRLLGAETALLGLVIWSILHFVTGHIPPHLAGPQLAGLAQPTAPAHRAGSQATPASPADQTTTATNRPAAGLSPAAGNEFLLKPSASAPPAAPPALRARPPRNAAASSGAEVSSRPHPSTVALPLAPRARRRPAQAARETGSSAGASAAKATATRLAGATLAARSRHRLPAKITTSPGAGEALARPRPASLARHASRQPRRIAVAASRQAASRSVRPAEASRPAADVIDSLHLRSLLSGLVFRRPDSLARVALPTSAYPAADSLPRPRPRPAWTAYRLRLGLVGAPELSTVRDISRTGLGGDVGVQLDCQPFRRWHLTTAYLLTLKRYAARPEDYHLPDGYTIPNGWVISNVDAVCRIADIPLNLRYDLWQRPRYQLFASVGLSSLLMQREQYTYDYEPTKWKQPVPSYSWELRNGSQHLLSVLNLSAGYERVLGQRWTLQAEPFVKLPLGGVGFGTVRLSSAGVFFSLRYGLLPAAR